MSFKLRNILLAVTAALLVTAANAQQMTNDDCLGCHGDPSAAKDLGNGKTQSVHVDPTIFGGSVHGSLGCTDCHAGVTAYPHTPAPTRVDCSGCHSDSVDAWKRSLHGKAWAAGNHNAAGCTSCHGGGNPHNILPKSDPKSSTFHANIPKTCGSCHGQKFVMENAGLTTQPAFSYQNSVHGHANSNGNVRAAVCIDCHNYHDVLGANDQTSPIFKFNIPKTCGKCHGAVASVYATSIHGKLAARGNWEAPVCTTCHGIHNIKSHIDPSSSVAAQNVARTTCGQCHGNVRMTSEFGLSSTRVKTYEDSYHGLARRLGSTSAANCASCHGVHNILPASDPNSTVNPKNLPHTCGRCHPGASEKFAQGRVHLEQIPPKEQAFGDKVMQWVSWIYVPLILLTLGAMALHNILIWVKKARIARLDPTRTITRMNQIQRIQHFLLVISFFALVISGFALAWPGSLFAAVTGGETIRRVIHRTAAVVMLVLGVAHIFYMVGTKEGRQGLKDFWFRIKDARDVVGVMKYYLGLSAEHPKMGRFTYAEKAEYWALVWGTIVMGVTGLMLWFEVQVSTWLQLPRWWVDVALMIHWYEAILATLAIIIWHLYAVIFDPDVYPVNWAWYDGKMREEQFRHEHGEAWEEMKHEGVRPEDKPRGPMVH